jgi:predicted RNase H-like HicB family nuclease
MTTTPPRYVVSDGTLTLLLERDTGSKWFSVTSPFNPKIITQARSVEEAFEMAYDALETLVEAEAIPRKRTVGVNVVN